MNDVIKVDSAAPKQVSMSNALVRAGQSLTLSEKRLVMLAVSKISSKLALKECPITRISAAEYADEYQVDMDTAYDQLRSASKHLFSRHLTFFEPAYKRNGKEVVDLEVNMVWVTEARYHKKEGWIELHWWHRLVPHLMGLKAHFTSYQLQQANSLRSIYSWRLLELLMRFQSTGWAQYTIEDFCTSMDATPKQRTDFSAIRRKMIEPAIKELSDKDGWIIKWEPIKAGRKVKGLRFDFSRNLQGQLF